MGGNRPAPYRLLSLTLQLPAPRSPPQHASPRCQALWGFEIEDADGEVFRNQSTGSGWGCDVLDWPGNLAVGFDGWSFVYTTLHRATDAFVAVSPGGLDEQWVSCGGDRVMRPPFKLRAITVEMNRTKLNLLGFEPTDPPAIRIR